MPHEPVVLVAVEPHRDRPPGPQIREQRAEARVRVREVVEDADRVDEVEAAALGRVAEREPQEVALHDMHVVERARGSPARPRRRRSGRRRRPRRHRSGAARYACRPVPQPASRTRLPAKKSRSIGCEPVQELVLELGVQLREVLPLPPERRRGVALLVDEVGRDEPRDAVADRPVRPQPSQTSCPVSTSSAVARPRAEAGRARAGRRDRRRDSASCGPRQRCGAAALGCRRSSRPLLHPAPVPELEDEAASRAASGGHGGRRGAPKRAVDLRGVEDALRRQARGGQLVLQRLAQLALQPRRDRDAEALLRRDSRCRAADVRAIARLSRCFVSKRRSLRRAGTRPRNSTSSTSRNGARTSSEQAMLARSTFTRMSSCRYVFA